jgi:cell division septal protein FtsQ
MYVDEVRVKKDFPSSIIIEVKPSVPTAMIQYNDTYLLISKNGKILEKLEQPNKNVPIIKGFVPASDIITKNVYWEYPDTNDESTEDSLKDDKERNKALKLICEQITNQELYSMVDFDISDVYSISANYQNRISIRLGNSSELDYKLKYAMQILTEQLPSDKEGYLIFRSNNQYQYVSKEDMEKHIEEIAEAEGIEPEEYTDIENESSDEH